MDFRDEVFDTLRSYVYNYLDPRTGEPFYVGKGRGRRFLAHLEDRSETEKARRIAEIRSHGQEPQIDFLRYGLSDKEATLVEAAVIDLLGKTKLTNRVSGYHVGSFGRIDSKELLATLSAAPVNVRHKAMLITINQLYRSSMTPLELYEATRGIWKVGPRRNSVEYAMALYQGVVREVYRVHAWYPAGTLEYKTRDASEFAASGRREFDGEVADDIRIEYVGFSVGRSGQNPIRYVNV